MLTGHAFVSLPQVRGAVAAYLAARDRRAQNNSQLYYCFMASIDATTIKRLVPKKDDFVVNGTKSGLALFKVFLATAKVNTRAVASNICKQLTRLDEFMANTAKHNIGVFNNHVAKLIHQLTARNKTSTNTVTNLFTAYCSCPDAEFHAFICCKDEKYKSGKPYSAQSLMDKAKSKYDSQILRGEWKQP